MLNETNITIEVARVIINSQTETNGSLTPISQILIPLVAIVTTGVITYCSITNNTRGIYIQANQTELKDALEELSKQIERGQPQEILEFLNSSQGIYIPKPMRIKMRKKCYAEKISKEQLNKMLDEINKYISP